LSSVTECVVFERMWCMRGRLCHCSKGPAGYAKHISAVSTSCSSQQCRRHSLQLIFGSRHDGASLGECQMLEMSFAQKVEVLKFSEFSPHSFIHGWGWDGDRLVCFFDAPWRAWVYSWSSITAPHHIPQPQVQHLTNAHIILPPRLASIHR